MSEIEQQMSADAALNPAMRRHCPFNRSTEAPNILIMPGAGCYRHHAMSRDGDPQPRSGIAFPALVQLSHSFRRISPDTRSVEDSNPPRQLTESASSRRNSMTEEALLKSAQRLTRMLGIAPSVATTEVDLIPGQPGQITFLVLRHNSYQMPPVPTRFEGNIVRIKIDGVVRDRSGPRYHGH